MTTNTTSALEIVQRRRGTGQRIVGPLEDLDRSDLNILLRQPGLGIQAVNNYENFFRTCDVVMTDSRTIELWEINQPLLVATVLKGMVRKNPQFEQLLLWLHSEAIQECETHIREVLPREESEESKGPDLLTDEDLLIAIHNSPSLTLSSPEDLTKGIDRLFEEEDIRPSKKENRSKETVIELTKVIKPGLDYARLEALEDELFSEMIDSAIDNALVDDRTANYTVVKAMMERIHGKPWNYTP